MPDGATLEYDVCIVGTGAAGTTAALSLAGRGLRIAVLEGGGTAPDAVSTAFTEVESTGRHVDRASRERWLGGTTNAWTGGKTTLDAVDLAVRPWVPHSGWPIDPARLRSCYERASALLDRPPPSRYDGPPDGVGDGVRFDGPDLRTLVFHEDAEPLRFGTLLLDRLRPGDGVDVITLANVTEVLLDDLGARVAGVEVATVNGRRLTVRAPLVVLGCGAVENARLLLASRSRRPAGLGNVHDVVGRYFQDHPKGFTAVLAVDPAARLPASGYWPARATAHGRTRWGVGLTEDAQRRDQVLNSYVRLEPTVLAEVPEAITVLKRVARGRVRGLDPSALAGLVDDAPDLVRLARFRLRNEGPIDVVRVRSFLEQEPRADNRVRLSHRRDPLGRPLAAVDWDLSDLDRRSVRVLHEALADSVRRHGLGDLAFDLDDDSPTWDGLTDASHHAGTTRMGTDPRTSVTDPDGRVHDVEGLYVAGASLFPTSGYANPVFTIAATALHVADAVAAEAATGAGPAGLLGAEPASRAVDLRAGATAAGRAEAKRWIAARRRARHPRPAASTAAAIVWTAPGRAAVLPVEVPDPGVGQVRRAHRGQRRQPGHRAGPVAGAARRRGPHAAPAGVLARRHDPRRGSGGLRPRAGHAGRRVGRAPPVVGHRGAEQVHPLAGGVDLDGASLVTLGAIAELGVARAGDVGGRSLAVVGAGAIGLLAQRIAAADGAKPCTVVAASAAKDEIVAGDPAAVVAPPAAVDGIGADVVIEATGAAAGLDLALRAAAPGGTVVVLGTTRAETVPSRSTSSPGAPCGVVGAHAGLLDAPGGTAGLDRRSAAQRFLDRVATGTVRVDDLVTFHADPATAADLLDRVGPDRGQVVPVIDWWRLAPDLRARPGGLGLPNPFRQGLVEPLGPAERRRSAAARRSTTGRRPAPPGRPSRSSAARRPTPAAVAAAARALAGRARCASRATVRWRAVAGRGPAGRPGASARTTGRRPGRDGVVPPRVVVDVGPTGESVAAGLAALGPDGVLLVAGRVGRVDLDVQTELHRRGTTIAGVSTAARAAGDDG